MESGLISILDYTPGMIMESGLISTLDYTLTEDKDKFNKNISLQKFPSFPVSKEISNKKIHSLTDSNVINRKIYINNPYTQQSSPFIGSFHLRPSNDYIPLDILLGKSIQLFAEQNSIDYDINYIDIEERSKSMDEISKVIFDFKYLEENWDTYGAKKIEIPTIVRAIEFYFEFRDINNAPIPFVSPVCNGSICFEWETINKKLTNYIPEDIFDCIKYVTTDKTRGDVIRKSDKATSQEEIIDIVKNWLIK